MINGPVRRAYSVHEVCVATPSELRNHVVTHSSDRPFKCGYCGRAFAGATTLNNHIRTHTGEKPFKPDGTKTIMNGRQKSLLDRWPLRVISFQMEQRTD
ncbi:hypothetical protein GOODEAATRI_025183 [Goodea atripinnis]|uniref:C2H2-type domain-containing protein n=1 Tax=Goodea atripinnis TaxID=208336 RepID=A0ABV0N449_9TELE